MTGRELTPFKLHTGLDDGISQYFDRHLPYIQYERIPFDLRRVALALFGSTYRSPITLLFPKEQACIKVVSDIAMTVELVHAIYEADSTSTEPLAAGYDRPEWYLRGMARFTDKEGRLRTAPMHVKLYFPASDDSEEVEVQVDCAQDLIICPD